jgi:hypothetical protein
MGLLFIPQVTYEHGEPWWNKTDKGKLLIYSPELSGNPTSSHLVASRVTGKGNDEFGSVKYFRSYLQVIFLHAIKSYDTGPMALLPL